MALARPAIVAPRRAGALQPRAHGVGVKSTACPQWLLERGKKLSPEELAFAVAYLEAQQLRAAVGMDAHGNHHTNAAVSSRTTAP